jgi:hypothetical protein
VRYRVHAKSASSTRFFRQIEDSLMIRENTVRRRAGLPELDAAAFHATLEASGAVERWRRRLRWRSQYYYRVAGSLLANGRWTGLGWLALSFALAPGLPMSRLRRQFLPWLAVRLRSRSGQDPVSSP